MRISLIALALTTTLGIGAAHGQPADAPPTEDEEPDTTAEPDEPSEAPSPAQPEAKPAAAADVDALRRRYLELRDKLFRSRARAAAVASALYSTRVQIKLDYKSARHYTVTRATIRLDGANVFDDTRGKIAADSAVRFEGYVAPGRHRVTIRIEAAGKDDERFVTATETTVAIVAPAGKDVEISARAEDNGDIAYRWQRKEKGNYRLGLDIDVSTTERGKRDAKGGRIKRARR